MARKYQPFIGFSPEKNVVSYPRAVEAGVFNSSLDSLFNRVVSEYEKASNETLDKSEVNGDIGFKVSILRLHLLASKAVL